MARVYDLRDGRWPTLIADAFDALLHRGERLIRVIGPSPREMGTVVDIILPEAPMWMELVDYSIRILTFRCSCRCWSRPCCSLACSG